MDGATGLANLVTAFGQFTEWFSGMAGTLLGNALFLIPLAIFCFGAVIGLVHRVIK